MQNKKQNENINDVLSEINILQEIALKKIKKEKKNICSKVKECMDFSEENTLDSIIEDLKELEVKIESKFIRGCKKILSYFVLLIKYCLTSSIIFAVLLLGVNYQAYYNLAISYINKDENIKSEQLLISSVQASNIKEEKKETPKILLKGDVKSEDNNTDEIEKNKNYHSIKKLISNTNDKNVNLDIEITPYENRIVIPKIGKNIPLIDIKNKKISGKKELDNIFMKELENGVVRYPSSAKPGKEGNTFIFGHSSNFPWIDGEYNEVFALLDKVIYDDEIVIYYGQKKFTYKIREKKVIAPGDVSLLKRNKKKSELTLMTCWPVGTTLNRLVVIGELVEE